MSGIVIIGGSHAGLSCAEKLRQLDYSAPITILERDGGLPVQRPPLSKAYLSADEADESAFLLRRPEFYDQLQIELKTETDVTAINAEEKKVICAAGQEYAYEKLILATGAVPRRLPMIEAGTKGVHVLRTAEDARALRADLPGSCSAVVIGGGYIGLEAAASLRKHGLDVHVLELADRLLARVASVPVSTFYADLHAAHGVHIHTGAAASQFISKDGHIEAVQLDDGQVIDCQLLLVGIGVIPDADLAQQAGIEMGNGLIVDADYQTNLPDIYAIGDVALCASRFANRIESIHHAQFSGAVVATHIAGGPAITEEAPWFWSDQYDVKLQIAGLVPGPDAPGLAHYIRPGRKEGSQSVWSYVEDKFISVESANDPKAYMVGKACLEKGLSPDPADITDMDKDLKLLMPR